MTASPETMPVPIVVIGGRIVHRASAVRQITGPRPVVVPARHATHNRATAAVAAAVYRERHRLDRVIRFFAAAIVVVEVVKTGVPWLVVRTIADGLMVATALTGR